VGLGTSVEATGIGEWGLVWDAREFETDIGADQLGGIELPGWSHSQSQHDMHSHGYGIPEYEIKEEEDANMEDSWTDGMKHVYRDETWSQRSFI
jgi:hypothetical protein